MSSDVIISVENLGKKYRIKHQAEGRRYTALRDVLAEKAKGVFQMLKLRKQKTEINDAEGQNKFPISKSPISALPASEDFWALRDVSFEVKRGEVVGIIGLPREIGSHPAKHRIGECARYVFRASQAERPFHRGTNGAGKSTLLKVLSSPSRRRYEPEAGSPNRPPAGCLFQRFSFQHFNFLAVVTGLHPELTRRENVFLNGAILGMSRAEIRKKFDETVAFQIKKQPHLPFRAGEPSLITL